MNTPVNHRAVGLVVVTLNRYLEVGQSYSTDISEWILGGFLGLAVGQ